MDKIGVSMDKFLKEYNKQYGFLYSSNRQGLTVAGEKDALYYFNNCMTNKDKQILKEFSMYKMDILSSDREAIAFIFTLDTMDLID